MNYLFDVSSMQGDLLNVKVNKLTSIKTQLPYSFYSLPYCKPEKIMDSAENLGEVLRGDRIENSPYVVSLRFCPFLYVFHPFLPYNLLNQTNYCLGHFSDKEVLYVLCMRE